MSVLLRAAKTAILEESSKRSVSTCADSRTITKNLRIAPGGLWVGLKAPSAVSTQLTPMTVMLRAQRIS